MNSFFGFLLLLLFQTTEVYNVNLTISNIKEEDGNLVIAVFDNEEDFMNKEKIIKYLPVTSASETMVTQFSLPKGAYSIAVFHDTNGNKELDKNYIGIPKEAFGFSNKSFGLFGPPDFDDTKFEVRQPNETVLVKLVHL